jgi:hypothetical protein
MAERPNLPGSLRFFNPIMKTLIRLGVPVGPVQILSVPGRRTGKLHSTPVTPITVGGQRYLTTVGDTDWVRNARASGWGMLSHGRVSERVGLVELPADERAPILREFPKQAPQGIRFYRQTLGISGDPDSFAAAAPRCRVFRVDAGRRTR